MNFDEKTKNQGTSQPEASQEEVNGASEWEELVELDDVQLATVVGGGARWRKFGPKLPIAPMERVAGVRG